MGIDEQTKVVMSSLLDEYKKNERVYERIIRLLEDKVEKLEKEKRDGLCDCGTGKQP